MLTLGVATADITPPPGAMMACFPRGGKPRRARGADDRLQAKALVLADDAQAVAICACDLTALRDVDVARIRKAVAARAPHLAEIGRAHV